MLMQTMRCSPSLQLIQRMGLQKELPEGEATQDSGSG